VRITGPGRQIDIFSRRQLQRIQPSDPLRWLRG
jgi:hypothetical protein